MNAIRPALKIFIVLFILTGIIYPLLITLIAQTTMPRQANGSLFQQGEHVRGSLLIAQQFKSEAYFWPRPSSIDYDPMKPSGGSNLGPTSQKLKEEVAERIKKINSDPSLIPSELVYASGSGLDPHISLNAAYFQIPRIVKARSIQNQNELKFLVDRLAEGIKEKYINVLFLNQEIDKYFPLQRP